MFFKDGLLADLEDTVGAFELRSYDQDSSGTWLTLLYEIKRAKNVLDSDLKKSRICQIWASLTHFRSKSGHPGLDSCN